MSCHGVWARSYAVNRQRKYIEMREKSLEKKHEADIKEMHRVWDDYDRRHKDAN